jgi:hypothetical protein
VLRTTPVKVTGGRLLLNLDTGALGETRVGLVDATGKAIAGFGADQSDALQINSPGTVVTWGGKSDLSALNGQQVRIEFRSRRTRLFSFRFE